MQDFTENCPLVWTLLLAVIQTDMKSASAFQYSFLNATRNRFMMTLRGELIPPHTLVKLTDRCLSRLHVKYSFVDNHKISPGHYSENNKYYR